MSDGNLDITRTFNGYGEISSQSQTAGGQELVSWTLVRDQNGRITRKTETAAGTTAVYDYTYDSMGRLLTVTKDGDLVEEYSYNANGARVLETNTRRGIENRVPTYSIEDHLITAGDFTYQYDFDSFLLSKTEGEDVTGFTYSVRGELLDVTLPDGTEIKYLHDPYGNRIAKKVDGVITEKYLWQGLTQLLAVYDGSDNLLMRLEYADGRMPVSVTKEGVTYYLAYDQVGSLRIVADGSGNVVKQITYDMFGNILSDTNTLFEIPFRFAGGFYDSHTGLLRFGFRDYDPEIGRWTAKDPILFAGGDVDLFAYALNDPVNLIDPYGLDAGVISGPLAVYGAMAAGTAATIWWYTHKDQIADVAGRFWNWLWNENTEDEEEDECPFDKDSPPTHPDFEPHKKKKGKEKIPWNKDRKGFPDKRGNYWEPVPDGHKGTHDPHWDVQHKDGTHTPVYPPK